MNKTVIYVDKGLITGIAAQLVGIQKQATKGKSGGVALSTWLVGGNLDLSASEAATKDIREMLPEHVLYMVYPEIKLKYDNVEACVSALADISTIVPGEVISVSGVLSFPDIELPKVFDPFSPPSMNVNVFQLYGERCFVGKLTNQSGFRLPIYFLEEAASQVCFFNDRPVEVTGLVRWSPSYDAGGARALNLVLRAAGLWLRW